MPYFYLLIIFLLFSCRNTKTKTTDPKGTQVTVAPKNEVKYVNSIKITSPVKNQEFRFHEKTTFSYKTKERFPVDSAHLFLNGKKIATLRKDIFTFDGEIPAQKTGNNTLKIIAFHPEDKRGVASINFLVKPDKAPRKYRYEVVKVYAHDPKAYTQGLIYQDGFLYESTGQYGESGIRKSDMKTGKLLSALNIDSQLFGEGITIYNDKIYQLTWTSRKGFIYDLKTFTLESTFQYNTQGWGITTVDDKLVMSDGSHRLYQVSPAGFSVMKEVEVYDFNGPVQNLNELEYIDGRVWANIWMEDRIVMIDPESGEVEGELDMSKLLSSAERSQLDDSDDVLNGIAWNPEKKTVYVTGKRWTKMFEIQVKED